jgi:Flp pilus assembly protein TadG
MSLKEGFDLVAQKAREYRLILWVLFLILLALGFDFRTPSAQFKELRRIADSVGVEAARRDSLVKARLAIADEKQQKDRELIVGLARWACISDPTRARLAIHCESLLGVSRGGR